MVGDLKRLIRPGTTFLVPFVGATLFDWQLQFVLLFYWFEIGVTIARQTVETTFAGRPNSGEGRMVMPAFRRLRSKRGGISLPGPFRSIHPRTAPSVVVGGALSLAIWVIAGTQIVALGGQVNLSAPPLEILLGTPVDSPTVLAGILFGAVGVVVGQLLIFVSNLQARSYEKLSARAIVGLVQILGSIVFLLVFITGLFLSGGELTTVRIPVFVAIVVIRACVDALDEFGMTERYIPNRIKPDTQIGDRDPVASGEGEPRIVWQVNRESLIFARALTNPGRVSRPVAECSSG